MAWVFLSFPAHSCFLRTVLGFGEAKAGENYRDPFVSILQNCSYLGNGKAIHSMFSLIADVDVSCKVQLNVGDPIGTNSLYIFCQESINYCGREKQINNNLQFNYLLTPGREIFLRSKRGAAPYFDRQYYRFP